MRLVHFAFSECLLSVTGCLITDEFILIGYLGDNHFLHTHVGDSHCVSKWYTTYVGDRFSEVITQ